MSIGFLGGLGGIGGIGGLRGSDFSSADLPNRYSHASELNLRNYYQYILKEEFNRKKSICFVVFSHGHADFTKKYIQPLAHHWHLRSDGLCIITFPGYEMKSSSEEEYEVVNEAHFDEKVYMDFIEIFQSLSNWVYPDEAVMIGFEVELIEEGGRHGFQAVSFDFENVLEVPLEKINRYENIETTEKFFGSLFKIIDEGGVSEVGIKYLEGELKYKSFFELVRSLVLEQLKEWGRVIDFTNDIRIKNYKKT